MSMRTSRVLWILLTLCVLAGVVAATALLVDYSSPLPRFCDPDAGCEALRRTKYAHLGPFSTPVLGLVAFGVLSVTAILRGTTARLAQALVGLGMGGVALMLIVVQIKVHTFCPFCMVVDTSSLLIFALSAARYLLDLDPPAPPHIGAGALAALATVAGVTGFLGMRRPPKTGSIPPVIAEELARTPPGKVTIIDFVDFECPFCRHTHEEFEPLLEQHKDQLRIVRKQVPLAIHAHALPAARAACCGETLGQGDAMADALMATPPGEFTPANCEKIAASLRLDVDAFRACMNSKETQDRITNDRETFKAAHCQGLPTIWVGTIKLEGSQDRADLARAIDAALGERT
jgi:protein-disulfide isomerase/uncharacterized membrane protein